MGVDAGYKEAKDNPFSVFLVDTETDEILIEVFEGSELSADFADLNSVGVMVAGTDEAVESVVMMMDGIGQRVESVEPYALFGDNNQGDFFGGTQLGSGDFTLSLSGHSENRGTGDLMFAEDFTFAIA